MDVSLYPGCSLNSIAREYGESVRAVCKTLDVNLVELPDWTCCGSSSAHITNDQLASALAARNLQIAEEVGLDLVVPCAMCFSRLKFAEKELLAGKKIEGISRPYRGEITIKHLVDFFWEDVGEEAIAARVKRPLEELNPVCYYGCLTVRPPTITDAPDPENPQAMDGLVSALGGNVRNWSFKTDCCGGSLSLTLPDLAHKMTQRILDMAFEAGADCISTGCPMCQDNLDNHQKEISKISGGEYDIPIFYFTELMGIAFDESSIETWLGRHRTDPKPFLKRKDLLPTLEGKLQP